MEHRKPFSFIFFIISLFYAPILNPYIPKTKFGTGIPDFGFYEIILFIWLSSFMLDIAFRRLKTIRACHITAWLIFLGFYSLIVIASVIWSYESYTTETIHTLFFAIFIPFLVAFMTRFYVVMPGIFKSVIFHAAISSIVLSIASVIHFITHKGSNIKELRAGFGELTNPNAMAIFLVLNISLLLYGFFMHLKIRKIIFSSLVANVLGILSTISRKGYATLMLSYLIFFVLNKKLKALLIILAVFTALTAVILGNQTISQRYKETEIKTHLTAKWNMTLAGIDMFAKRPIYGWGYRGYYNKFGEYFKYSNLKKYVAHNNYVTALANYGLIGFIPFILIFLYPLCHAFPIMRKVSVSSEKYIAASSLISLILPFMINAWFAGKLMYQPIIVNLFYFYVVLFLCKTQS